MNKLLFRCLPSSSFTDISVHTVNVCGTVFVRFRSICWWTTQAGRRELGRLTRRFKLIVIWSVSMWSDKCHWPSVSCHTWLTDVTATLSSPAASAARYVSLRSTCNREAMTDCFFFTNCSNSNRLICSALAEVGPMACSTVKRGVHGRQNGYRPLFDTHYSDSHCSDNRYSDKVRVDSAKASRDQTPLQKEVTLRWLVDMVAHFHKPITTNSFDTHARKLGHFAENWQKETNERLRQPNGWKTFSLRT